jgi:hypothetical protein
MVKTSLEERLEAITRDFVQRIVATIRSASFAEVAGYSGGDAVPPPRAERKVQTRVVASPKRAALGTGGGGGRQTADRRAELSERVVAALRSAGQPLGVRALSSELGVAPDLLAVPLRELRAAGRVAKHGEKRATTYSLP